MDELKSINIFNDRKLGFSINSGKYFAFLGFKEDFKTIICKHE